MTNPNSSSPGQSAGRAGGFPTVVLFDIDGTVADCRHRQHHIEKPHPDWESFFANSEVDKPLAEGVALALMYATDNRLAWLTGRPERYRDITMAWLQAHGLPTTGLHMRPDNDTRPAAVFKAECVRRVLASRGHRG